MYKLFLVARHEYTQRATQKSFLLGTLVMPLLFAVLIGVAVFIFALQRSDLPFGYVDYSGLLTDEIMPIRMAGGKPRAEAVRYVGADYLATPCAICKAQLPESMHYWDVPVKVGGVIDLLHKALIL